MSASLQQKITMSIQALGGNPQLLKLRGLPAYADAEELVVADVSKRGFQHRLAPVAARAWESMKAAAHDDGVSLILISGYRSFDRQFDIISRRITSGESIDDLFAVLAPPGCSQHHTGRALDIGTRGCEPASLEFSHSAAFRWLQERAGSFGFELSYPENNEQGYLYEPWHWFLTDSGV